MFLVCLSCIFCFTIEISARVELPHLFNARVSPFDRIQPRQSQRHLQPLQILHKLLAHRRRIEAPNRARALADAFPFVRREEPNRLGHKSLEAVRLGDAREKAERLLEAEAGEVVARRNIGEDNEAAMAVGSDLAEHVEEDLDEPGIDGGDVSLALVVGERREPFED
ncbi:hypothetical protein SO802_019267 [Lithocarpus litseifolius]|uniref:Uncharacterized protein n=1 Tax=Lithocarpus litseifolius TaxID=425828 RepID=A0AAW2CSE8_9ROSI